jgi:hypothetical protein
LPASAVTVIIDGPGAIGATSFGAAFLVKSEFIPKNETGPNAVRQTFPGW